VKLAIEIDGPHHRLPEVRARDVRRDRRLEGLGWQVMRFSEEAVAYRPWTVVGDIHRKLIELGISTQRVPQRLPDR
jgi:very-short-patch-repair endonuclease